MTGNFRFNINCLIFILPYISKRTNVFPDEYALFWFRCPPVVNPDFRIYFISVQDNLPDLLFDTNPCGLRLCFVRSGVTNDVVFEYQVVRLPSNTNPGGFSTGPIVFNDILFETIAMGGHSPRFVAEKDPIPMVQADKVATKQIVGIFVPDGNAESTVPFQNIVFKQPVPDPPAQKQTVGSITAGDTLADDGAL